MPFQIRPSEGRTIVFDNEHSDRFTSTFLTGTVEGMRSDIEWKDGVNLTPREGRKRCVPADEFAIEYARSEGWIDPEKPPTSLPTSLPVDDLDPIQLPEPRLQPPPSGRGRRRDRSGRSAISASGRIADSGSNTPPDPYVEGLS